MRTPHPAPRTLLLGCSMIALVLVPACSPGRDHEQLGDRRYAEHAYVDALAEYRLAMRQGNPTAELRAKLGEAALRAGALNDAVAAYRDLAASDPAGADLAADGLTMAANLAMAARDMSALEAAVLALNDIAPRRPVGVYAVALGASATGLTNRPMEMDVLLEGAAATANPATADSFLVAYGQDNASLGRCDVASRVFEGVLRRSPLPGLARAAEGGLARCVVEDGRLALSAGALRDAEARFQQAIAIGQPDSVVRVAWLLTGDARWAGGDTAGALVAYRHAVAGANGADPSAARAEVQIQRLLGQDTTAAPPDSGTTP